MAGFVSFVGSGPGDPELLTLKALKRLKQAEVVLYDDLSAGNILDEANANATLVGVGKRAGRHSPKQHHVSQLLVDYAQLGGQIVRLKSGDPGIFGRLEEEIDALDKARIPFEIIPGVTSASAAAAAAALPLTRRLNARRLQFVTGHDAGNGCATINGPPLTGENRAKVFAVDICVVHLLRQTIGTRISRRPITYKA